MSLRLLRSELADNAYAREIDAVLPRVLALPDRDPLSPTLGYGDRQFWAWKLIDFPNGTLQGAVNGLSALLEADAFAPHVPRARIKMLIGDMQAASLNMMRHDGSFEEALPYEQSYCVTALVAYDHLCAAMRLGAPPADVRPLERAIGFLVRRDETHGFISNHLATAIAALRRWDRLAGDAATRRKADALLARVLVGQSEEGWFVEYGGADPGYQTLCMTHLADAAETAGDERLWAALERGAAFLSHFVHPDGSFGGIYGSRATRVYYPAAMEALARRSPLAAGIATRMKRAIGEAATVPLAAIDQPNLMPVFNNYCQALLAAGARGDVPEWQPPAGRRWMPQAGLMIDVGPHHHTVISTRKGGVVYHWRNDALVAADAGIALRDGTRLLTGQGDGPANTTTVADDEIRISGQLRPLSIPRPNAFNFLVLRMLGATVMRLPALNALVKRLIAGILVRTGRAGPGTFTRRITLGPDLRIADEWQPSTLARVVTRAPFSAIHMASAGYWQAGDLATDASEPPGGAA
jgi:hypothetical protein